MISLKRNKAASTASITAPVTPLPSSRKRHEITVMSSLGDTQMATWDPELAAEVDSAFAVFTSLKAKGYLLYKPDGGASSASGEKLTTFDPAVEVIIAVRQPVGG
jgi:hypothetical protein